MLLDSADKELVQNTGEVGVGPKIGVGVMHRVGVG